jgi:hypothetical protein
LNRVPELPQAHEGVSMRWVARAARTLLVSVVIRFSLSSAQEPDGHAASTGTSSPVVTASDPFVNASTASATLGQDLPLEQVRWA